MPTKDEMMIVSNDLDDFTTPSIGPEQARGRVKSCEYIAFDYGGTMKDKPTVSVKMIVEPQDGENDGKDFEINWSTGAEMSEFAIVNDGGALLPTASKATLKNTSNWALFLQAAKDCGFNTKLLNGDAGIGYFASGDGAIIVFKHINQPARAGLETKNQKGFDKKYYTCLKIERLPGEKGKRAQARPAERQVVTTADIAVMQAPAQAQPATNGSAGPFNAIDVIKAALASAGGSIAIVPDLQKILFTAIKISGEPVNRCSNITREIIDPANLDKLAAANSWIVDEGVLVRMG